MIRTYSYATEMKVILTQTLHCVDLFAADCYLYVLVQMQITEVPVFLQPVSCPFTYTHTCKHKFHIQGLC